ncbi:MAG: sialate O-acetylesterase [Verrucomicrobiales bacterium]|nr:sialate O-acetylesterase [Verrucomicrobiae bacterium]MCP5552737.1 sialate O-acetylesterase [Akkermansiaceae bacterium]
MKTPALLLFTLCLAVTGRAGVTLPAVFSDHMVLQSDLSNPVWGWAAPGEPVTVSIGGQTQTTTTGPDGTWSVKLAGLTSREALTMTVQGTNTLTVQDVLIGEVWLCSGQSNMAWKVPQAQDFGKEQPAANHPALRMFYEASGGAGEPQSQGRGQWLVCSPETIASFSATAYFFGRHLHQELGKPVGLIVSCVGGTPIESWISPEAQRTLPEMKARFDSLDAVMKRYDPAAAKAAKEKEIAGWKEAVAKAKAEGSKAPNPPNPNTDPRASGPGNLFNGKIAPLVGYGIRGAIWYQGESNAFTVDGGKLYAKQLPLLIKDWRTRWGRGDLPFAWVQLPNFHNERFLGWREVRESMLKTLAVPNTGMAVALDLGESTNIHPQNKQEVGRRLGLWALARVYGRDLAFSGPLPAGHEVQGSEIVVSFDHADGLQAKGGGEVTGFQIAGEDKQWHTAKARIDGGRVIISSPDVPHPVAVRYAWEDDPKFNLYNGADLPTSPFRTDDW